MGMTIQCDGSSLHNPGPSGAGVLVLKDGQPIAHLSIYLGKMLSNNEAEYHAVFYGVKWVIDNTPCRELLIYTDSQLVIHQLRDEWSTNNLKLKKIKHRVLALTNQLKWQIKYQHWSDEFPPHTLAQRASKSQRDHIEVFPAVEQEVRQ